MRVERRALSPTERGVLQERLQPRPRAWGERCCFWVLLPAFCGGLAFLVGVSCIGYPLTYFLKREFSKSPLSWAGLGPGYGLLILTLLLLFAGWVSVRLDDKRLRARVRRDLIGGESEVLRARPTAAVIGLPAEGATRGDPAPPTPSPPAPPEEPPVSDDADDGADADPDAPNQITIYLRIAPTEVLVLSDPDLLERRRGGFPHMDVEFSWGPKSRVLLGTADEGATLDDVVEVARDDVPRVANAAHGELLIYSEPRDTLLALLAAEPCERRRLWEHGTTANTLTRRLRLRR